MEEAYYLAIVLFGGLLAGRVAKLFKLPNVTGYLVVGLFLGPSFFGLLPHNILTELDFLAEIALGFIAFSIGCEFKINYFKRVGFTPVVIALFEALVAVFFVTGFLILAGYDLAFSIVLGSIAAATAPAATIMVIKQYKAKGPLTETLLSVVALDDAVALVGFGLASAIAQMIISHQSTSLIIAIIHPLLEVGGSLLVGGLLGALFAIPIKYYKEDSNRLIWLIGFVFIAIAIATNLKLSTLLTCMSMGAVLANVSSRVSSVLKVQEAFTPPLFLSFFVLSGAELDIKVLASIGVVGIIYIIARTSGKIVGAYLGAKIMNAEPKIRKYLGFTLLPQAGVAIGLTLIAQDIVPEYAQTIRAVVLCGTLIYEIIGPTVSKLALQAAGEIKE
ncbi:MAG: cation:proton antiporter [Erysipelotrichaceae bacterium]